MKNYTPVIIIKQNMFPFGVVDNDSFQKNRNILVKTKIHYQNQSEYADLKHKTEILKQISHKNLINIRHIQEIQRGNMNIYYNYVYHNFQYFRGCTPKTVKDIHKQLIQLVIHLAKNSIMTTFNINRCGVKIVQGRQEIKFYLPITQMKICSQMSVLERSVQLFTVQSMHALDQLAVGYGSLTNTEASKLSLSQRLSFYQQRGKSRADSLNVINSNKKLDMSRFSSRKLSSKFNTTNSSATLKTRRSTLNTTKRNSSRQQSPQQKYFQFKESLLQRITLLKNRSKKALKVLKQYIQRFKKAQKIHKKQINLARKTKSLQSLKKRNKSSNILIF